ncbi:AlpA family transcriptional regulator [uncultured Mobiluncus sp.]|uniref:helix-turn-helix transcriptional regulator n=1 Tax=Mobiluncus sp. TaxID=47293 RepID=UPI0026222ADB|nr:helix-turn-helix domain-containing protein [uncultured Mobiluncus sp.]
MVSDSLPALLTEREAAQFLRVHPSTLCRWAKTSNPPIKPVFLTPKIRRYRRCDLEQYAGIRA